MGRGDRLVVAIVAMLVVDTACAVLLALIVAVSSIMQPEPAHASEFRRKPCDRPVLETVQQVWEARTTGVSRFHFDGVYYVVENLPKGYVDYSSWYVRMP